MAHQTTEEYLNRENMEEYFRELALEIKEAGIGRQQILVVGGAAMALKYHDGRSTVDIDICIREQKNLYACCQKVATKHGLPDDWINADVMHSDSFSYGLFRDARQFAVYEDVLEILLVSDLDLYCMKLVSFRPKDVQDMEILAGMLKKSGIHKQDVETNFIRLYGSKYLMQNDERKIIFVDVQFQ